MDYVKLGRTGLDVSRICLGCMSYGGGNRGNHAWSLSEEESKPFIKKALEAGINFFDTANRYSLGDPRSRKSGTLPAATRLSSPPRYTDACAPARTAPGFPARRSLPRSTPASAR